MDTLAFRAQSNRASWRDGGLVTDIDDNPIDIANYPIVFEIADDGNPVMTASTANGKITIVATGVFQWFFTVTDMRGLWEAKTYQIGITITSPDGTETQQLAVGYLPIVDGIVP